MSVRYKIRVEEKGFSLIEVLVTMVIAMVVLGGLLLTFTQQNTEYKYQNKRIDAVQDLEFGIKFIAEDLRSALIDQNGVNPLISWTDDIGTDPYTAVLNFTVWDNATAGVPANRRALRRYAYDGTGTLSYDRHSGGGSALAPMLSNVTFFKIFADNDPGTFPRGNFLDIPGLLPSRSVIGPNASVVNMPGLTVLIEIAVDAGYKEGSFKNVLGVDVGVAGKKRVWRYIQVHPMSVVE